ELAVRLFTFFLSNHNQHRDRSRDVLPRKWAGRGTSPQTHGRARPSLVTEKLVADGPSTSQKISGTKHQCASLITSRPRPPTRKLEGQRSRASLPSLSPPRPPARKFEGQRP